jgi:hypothetical protein
MGDPIEASRKLHRLLNETISDLKQPERMGGMRGLMRLANATENFTKTLDEAADKSAQNMEQAAARGMDTVRRFDAHADRIRQTSDEADRILGQLSNMLPLSDSDTPSGDGQ